MEYQSPELSNSLDFTSGTAECIRECIPECIRECIPEYPASSDVCVPTLTPACFADAYRNFLLQGWKQHWKGSRTQFCRLSGISRTILCNWIFCQQTDILCERAIERYLSQGYPSVYPEDQLEISLSAQVPASRKITLNYSLISPNRILLDHLNEVMLVDIINYSHFLYKLVTNFEGIHLIVLSKRTSSLQVQQRKMRPLINDCLRFHPRCSFAITHSSEGDAVECHITSLISQLDYLLPRGIKITVITRDYFIREVICQLRTTVNGREVTAPFLKSDFVTKEIISPVFLTYYEETSLLTRQQLIKVFRNIWTKSIIDFCREYGMSRMYFAMWLNGNDMGILFNSSATMAVRSLLLNYKPDIPVNENPDFQMKSFKSFCGEIEEKGYQKLTFSFSSPEGVASEQNTSEMTLVFFSNDESVSEKSTDKYKILRTIVPSPAAKKHLVILTAMYLNVILPRSTIFDLSGVGISELEEMLFHRCRVTE